MKQGLFIDRGPFETRVALIERERVVEIHVEPTDQPPVAGAIWRGRVTDLMPELQAAAVDLGQGVTGFLRAADARVLDGSTTDKRVPLKKLLRRGQSVLVQAVRGANAGKQVRLSADIALHGRYVSLYPQREGTEVPKRIGDPDQRASLQEMFAALDSSARLVARPAAARVEPDLVRADATRLIAEWTAIDGLDGPVPDRLRDAPGLLHRALTELAPPAPEAIAVSDRSLSADLHPVATRIAPDLVELVSLAPSGQGLELDQVLDEALAQEVRLPGGGRIIIEATTALTAIDVDSAGARGTPVDHNMRAIPEIAHQIRLRRIGGPVVIDFISMRAGNERKRVEAALRRAFERDPVMVDIGQIDRFSLATLVRGRGEKGLAQQLLVRTSLQHRLRDTAAAARVLRQAAAELDGVGLLPVTLTLSEQLRTVMDADATARASAFLGRPVSFVFEARDIGSFAISRQR
ncbi:MAG: ribonuclease E/G [Minwuia sp.]|nr:ribonuclease E/G [Minwuia sp.]